jgi:hypothetical protein
MPSRTAMAWAVPRCRARRMIRSGQHGVHFTCLQPMRYDLWENEWVCRCGAVQAGERVAWRNFELQAAA